MPTILLHFVTLLLVLIVGVPWVFHSTNHRAVLSSIPAGFMIFNYRAYDNLMSLSALVVRQLHVVVLTVFCFCFCNCAAI